MSSGPQDSSYIDITVVGQIVPDIVERWSIPEFDFLSDHRMISFGLKITGIDRVEDFCITTNHFNNKKGWNMFYYYSTTAENGVLDLLDSCTQSNGFEECVYHFQKLIISAAEKLILLKKSGFYKVN